MNKTEQNESMLCEDSTISARTDAGSNQVAETEAPQAGEYADEFVRKFMTDSSAEAFEPEVVKGAENAPLSAKILEENVVTALKQIFDPEIPINIYDLGLIYKVAVDESGYASIDMTLTTPGCPVAQTFPGQVEQTVRGVDGICGAKVELVWDPPWTKARMSQAALLQLGLL